MPNRRTPARRKAPESLYSPPARPPADYLAPDTAPIYNAAVRVRLGGRRHHARRTVVVDLWREVARQLAAGHDPEAVLVVLFDALMPACATWQARLAWYDRAAADYLAAVTTPAIAPTACAPQSMRAALGNAARQLPQ